MAFIGGYIQLPGSIYRPMVGVLLIIAGVRLFWSKVAAPAAPPHDPAIPVSILCGAAIGLLAGLTGTGGGIFLSPLLILAGWSEARTASGVSAVFILCNSVSGLAGNLASLGSLPPELPVYAAAVFLGAIVGPPSEFGSLRRSS